MGYEDFVYFILSEEDKTNNISLDYWFKCIDLDCDGSLRANEMLVSGSAHMRHTLRTLRRVPHYEHPHSSDRKCWCETCCHGQCSCILTCGMPAADV